VALHRLGIRLRLHATRANGRLRRGADAGSPEEGALSSTKTLVIRNGTLINGSGKGAARKQTITFQQVAE
jgi:hypothetical protein